MRRARSLVRFAVVSVALVPVVLAALAAVATPAAAQSVNRAVIDELNTQLLYVALPLTLFVELVLFYAIYRFRDNDDPKPTADDPALEITWTSATAVILVFVGVSGYFVLANPYISPSVAAQSGADAADVEVEVVAYQWGWEFRYPEQNVTTQDRLVVPENADVRLVMESEDVIHSLYVPGLGIKQDVFPDQTTVVRTRPTETGEYDLFCAELCGTGHSRMNGEVVVMNQRRYDAWLAEQSGNESAATGPAGDDTAGNRTEGTETTAAQSLGRVGRVRPAP